MIDRYKKEDNDYDLAKLDSEIHANYLSFVLRRMLERINKLFPIDPNNGKKRECNSFSRRQMWLFLTDTATDLREAYDNYGFMLDAYTRIPPLFDPDCDNNPEKMFVSAKYAKRIFAVYTPLAIKSNRAHVNSQPYRESVCRNALRNIPSDLFAGVQQLQEYLIMVYPKDTGEYDVIDLDNLDTKVFGDEITQYFSYDDNCRRLPTIIMYSIFTDELPKGFYTLFVPENDRVLSRKNVKKWLKKLFKSPCLFVKSQNTNNQKEKTRNH